MEALINSLKSGKLCPYTISTVVVSLKICFVSCEIADNVAIKTLLQFQ